MAGQTEAEKSKWAIVRGIILYSLCSSTLLVLNKVAVVSVPSRSLVLLPQFFFSVVAVLFGRQFLGAEMERLTLPRLQAFFGIALSFCVCLYTNVAALEHANMETVIIFRAASPLAVAIVSSVFQGTAWPTPKNWAILLTVFAGACVYVWTDVQGVSIANYGWVMAYFVSIVFEMVYVKHIMNQIGMSTWGCVYYNNFISLFNVALIGIFMGETDRLAEMEWTAQQIYSLAAACCVGVAMSYAGFNLRGLVSATTFTLVGVLNKLLSITINLVIWDNHAGTTGTIALIVCILVGTQYRPPPKKTSASKAIELPTTGEQELEKENLLPKAV